MTLLHVGAPDATAHTVADAATAFAARLSDDQRDALLCERTPPNAMRWSNLPDALLDPGRPGLSTGTLDADQWQALHALLAAALGRAPGQGYDEICGQLAADDELRALGDRYGYGRGRFVVAFLGAPEATGMWQLQFGGHHLAVLNSYAEGRLVAATPSFRGVEPFVGGPGTRPSQRKQQALAALLRSLDRRQLDAAATTAELGDVALGPGRDWAFPDHPSGLPGAMLDERQRELLLAAIGTYVADVDEEAAGRFLAGYGEELDETYVARAGGTDMDHNGDYVRIDGPSVWIECLLREGYTVPGPHPHSVWRDKLRDYGAR